MLSCISALGAWGGLCFSEVPDQLHKCVLKARSGLAVTRKKVSGAPDKDWVPLPSLQQRVCHLRCTNTDYLSLMQGCTAAHFLSFMGVQSKALKINCEALQRIYLCHSGCINH